MKFIKYILPLLSTVTIVGCQTPHQKALALARDRAQKLAPLARYTPTVCDVEAKPTQPALARFSQMYPGEVEKLPVNSWSFKWRQSETRCEITADKAVAQSPVIKAQTGFLEAAFCMLNQVFYVNSPFDDLRVSPDDITMTKESVRIGPPQRPTEGIFLSQKDFEVTTKTKRGDFKAIYKLNEGEWLPSQMEHTPENLKINLDQIEYGEKVAGRRVIRSMVLSVGTERAFEHSQLTIRSCRSL